MHFCYREVPTKEQKTKVTCFLLEIISVIRKTTYNKQIYSPKELTGVTNSISTILLAFQYKIQVGKAPKTSSLEPTLPLKGSQSESFYLVVFGAMLWSLSTVERSTLVIPTSVETLTFSCNKTQQKVTGTTPTFPNDGHVHFRSFRSAVPFPTENLPLHQDRT